MRRRRQFQALFIALSLAVVSLLASSCCLIPEMSSEGVLRLWDTGPVTLDPAVVSDQTSHIYVVQIFSGLVRLGEDMEVVPDIAESWELSPDGRTYTFRLRRGVLFHSGRELKAEDFRYSLERACDPRTRSLTAGTYLGDIVGVRDRLEGTSAEISGVRVVDDYTLELRIDAPKAYFLRKLTYPTAFVLDRENVESGADWWLRPNGTGPFELQDWRRGQWFTLLPNHDYYGEQPLLRQVVFHILAGRPMALYEKGQIDVAPVQSSYVDQVMDPTGPFLQELSVTPELSLFYIGFNTAEPPFDDANVRRAFAHAVDKERIIRLLFRDMVTEANGVVPVGMPGYNEDLEGLDYDVVKARELIAASGYGDAGDLPPVVLTVSGYGGVIPDYVGAIVQDWRDDLGVEVSVRQLETENFLYNVKEEKDHMFIMGWVADYPDPHNFLDNLFRTGNENNAFEYSNPELDALLDRAAVERNTEARLAMYRQAERLVVEDAPCVPLWFGRNYVLVKPYVESYGLSPLGVPDLSLVSVERH